MAESEKPTLYCSFCGKSQHDVLKLIAGPKVFICDECIELCRDIVGAERMRADDEKAKKPEPDPEMVTKADLAKLQAEIDALKQHGQWMWPWRRLGLRGEP